MIQTNAITFANGFENESMVVTWDIGKRCNFDCTYCAKTSHDNVSNFTSFDDLKKTFHFIKEWSALYKLKSNSSKEIAINFTGGEPTINPYFWELIDYIKQESRQYALCLTTNGSWGKKYSERIATSMCAVTISYHAEGSTEHKQRAIDNILSLAETNIWLQVNVMLHTDHWEECIEVCNLLKEKGIRYNPRPIGDGRIERSGWFIDSDGSQRRTSHPYTPDQKTWFWAHMGIDKKDSTSSEGTQLGRACCGGRCLQGKVGNTWQDVKLVNTEFKGWSCSVDWLFLHIDQQLGLVYTHQTCQAKHDGTRGPLGTLNETDTMLAELAVRLENPKPIICPNDRCGCGMCAPKAKDPNDFKVIWAKLVSVPTQETLP